MSVIMNLESVIKHISSKEDLLTPTFAKDNTNRAHKAVTEETVKALKRKYKLQAMYWKNAYADLVQKMQSFQKEKNEELAFVSTQLLIFESKLRKRDRSLTNLITDRDDIIAKQKQIIDTLTDNLKKANSVAIHAVIKSHQTASSTSTDSGIVDEVESHTMSFISEELKGEEVTGPVIDTISSPREYSMKKSWNFLKNFKSAYVRSISEDAAVGKFENPNEVENIHNMHTNATGQFKSRKVHITRRKTISTGDLDLISKSHIRFNNATEHPFQPVTDARNIESNDYTVFDRALSINNSFKKTGEEKFQRINRSTSKNLQKICHMFAKS